MRSRLLHYRDKLVVLLLILLSLIISIAYIFLFSYFKETENKIYSDYIEKLNDEYNITIDGYTEMAELVFRNSIATKGILDILYKAATSDTVLEKDKYRNNLLNELSSVYSILSRYNFRQLHFHEADNRSFLRFHKPEKYGDNLTGIRYSVEYVNKNKERISGFEEGRIFNGYRNVYPLIFNGKHIGSVELSISMAAVIQQLEKRFNQQSQFIILKSVVDEKVFASELSNYRDWNIDNDFVLDKNVSTHNILGGYISNSDRNRLKASLTASKLDDKPFAIKIKHGNRSEILTFLPIHNFGEETVAFIFSISDDTNIQAHQRSFRIITITLLILIIFSILFMLYFLITNKRIQNMVQFDQLTKAYTRRLIFMKLDEEFIRYKRYNNSFSICMIDIDHFKKVNDKFGHQAGDTVLEELSEIIMSKIRNTDYFGRYGGEEFLLILTETDNKTASLAMENIRVLIENHIFKGVKTVTVSAGIATINESIAKSEILVEQADNNLYKAKQNGRNQIYPLNS